MATKKHTHLRLLFISVLLSVFYISSCGYSIHRHADLPFKEIHIGLIENRTLEPKLQDKLHSALTEEFLRYGISINPSAGRTLTAIINKFNMVSLMEKDEITIEYQVVISADFSLLDEKGNTIKMKNVRSPFIVSFEGSEDFGTLLANRDGAEKNALRDVAMEVVGSLIYK